MPSQSPSAPDARMYMLTHGTASLLGVCLFNRASIEGYFISVFGLSVLGKPFQLMPEILNVTVESKLQQVNLQWTVPNLTHQELNMVFQIEISRMKTSNIIWVVSILICLLYHPRNLIIPQHFLLNTGFLNNCIPAFLVKTSGSQPSSFCNPLIRFLMFW